MQTNNVVHVDFQTKQVIKPLTSRQWICLVCKQDFCYDSSRGDNTPYVSVRPATKRSYEQGICKECAKTVHNFVEQEGW